jgi:hypothetical protein
MSATDHQVQAAVMAYVQAGKRGVDLFEAMRCAIDASAALQSQQGEAKAVEQSPYEAITLANLRAGKLSAARVYVGYCEVSEELKAANGAIKRYQTQAEDPQRATAPAPAIAAAIHYPDHWDTAAYPTAESALSELTAWFKCSECKPAPATLSDARRRMFAAYSVCLTDGHKMMPLEIADALLAAAGNGQGQDGRILHLLREARATLGMWKDVAPAVSLCADIDTAMAAQEGA